MPTLRPEPGESTPPPTGRPEVGGLLFPPRDANPRPRANGVALGPYVIEDEIGRGGMGAVFRALDTRLDRIVALKVLGPDLSRDRSSVSRFQNEARAAARLDHESIARVHDVGHDHGLYYIAFEFVPGSNLREVLARHGGTLSPDEAVGYTLQIADALRHTAAVDVVHRDIKPSNIILSPTGRAKLVDWGLARQNSLDLSQDLTQTGTTLGTFDYISPEQAIDPRNVDVRSDIYSLGCTLFHMLTGEPPYPKGSMFQKVLNHHRPDPPDATARNPAVPEELSDIVRQMMASEPSQRYATPDELIADLSSVAAELGLRPASPVSGIWMADNLPAPRERMRAGWGWLGAFVALIVLVWSVDRSSRRLPVDPLDSPSTTRIPAPPPIAPDEPAPEAPSAEITNSPRPASGGILQGATTAPGGASRDRFAPPSPVAGGGDAVPPLPGASPLDSFLDFSAKSFSNIWPPSGSVPANPAVPVAQDFVLKSSNEDLSAQRFSSLEAAMLAAQDDDVIELDFDGPAPEIVRPIRTSKRVTVQAAFRRRPQLEIGLSRNDIQSASITAPKIFTVAGGALTLKDIDLVLRVQGDRPSRWSIFSLSQAGRVNLRGVSLTISNTARFPVAVFDAGDGASAPIAGGMAEAMLERPLEISLEGCVVRGAGDFLWQASSNVLDVRVAQSAFALNGAFFRQTTGGAADSMVSNLTPNDLVLEHVTAVLERPLVLVELGDREPARPLAIDCRNSILKITDPLQPLVSMSGEGDVNDYLDSLTWNGRYNTIELRGPACEIATRGVNGPLVTTVRYDDWSSRWLSRGASENELRATSDVLTPSPLWSGVDFSGASLTDFELTPSVGNPAWQGAEDGGRSGVDLEQRSLPRSLPQLPAVRTGAAFPARIPSGSSTDRPANLFR